ncbi:uncharacterized protein LOC128167449 isoform X2 [Crassostrea angulata]|uniref:uncharacterized protein LOC128167449 isoform X2 n=1 Tax=Magallana angulata TaxID=2784310 RepID=UPI0022B0B2E1|nr:uncharacterized protein LOC128167449 isoform X2 [Crassostrea angulata]
MIMTLCRILTIIIIPLQCFIFGSPTLQRLVFSADDIKGWRFLSNTQGNEKSFIYIMNTTDICFGAICSQECNLTIVSHDEPSSPQNGTIECRNQLQQCRMSGTNQVSFSVRGSCSSSSDFVRLAVIDNRAGVCGEDRPLCFNDFGTTTSSILINASNRTDLAENATWSCCNTDKTPQPLSLHTKRKPISRRDMDIALGVTVSLSVLVVSVMLFLIGRLLYRTRHVVKVETSIGSFDIVNPSDGVFDDPSRFLSETYIHIRKVSESNTDETPAPSPTGQPQESCFDAMTSRNPRTHYGRFSTFTGRSSEGFPHKCSAKTDGRFQSTHPR